MDANSLFGEGSPTPEFSTLQAFFDGASSALVGLGLVDSGLRFVAVNETLAEINGYPVEAHLGQAIPDLLPDLTPILLPIYQQVFETQQPVADIEISGETPRYPGATRYWIVSYVPVQGADQSCYVGAIVVEVTRNKRLIAQLERLNQELQRSNSDLEQFARTASHDLQEPLRTISSYAQLFRRRYEDLLDDRGRRYLNYITSSAQRSQSLIQDLLAYARANARPIEPTDVDLGQLLTQIVETLEATLRQTGGTVTWDPLPTVRVDRAQLTQVLQNLLSNALKYRCPDVAPEIHVWATRQDGAWRIAVSDNGIGIDTDYQERIFEVFQRLHLREEYEGTGIGLSICQKIIERNGGRIWVESASGAGSTFFFTLPDPLPPEQP